VYLPNGLRIGGDGQTIRERKSAAIRGAASCRCALGRGRTIHNVKIIVAEEFAPEGCDTVLTDVLCVLHRPICLFLHLAIGQEGIWGDEAEADGDGNPLLDSVDSLEFERTEPLLEGLQKVASNFEIHVREE